MVRRLPLMVAAVTLVLGSCAADSDDTVVLPAEDVIEGEIRVVPDPSGTKAAVQVTTSVDMVCAVVFGTTPELGDGIATDSDMGGGAHSDHEAILTGLQPDTEYYYRVQGSGANGELYQSEVRTFRTPNAESVDRAGENVATAGKVAGASSEFSGDFTRGQCRGR